MSFTKAIAADHVGNLEVAALEYEATLAADEMTLEGLLNLAVLYWQATDFGMVAAKALPTAFVAQAGRRFPLVLADARHRFPESTAVAFWSKYIPWADLGEEFPLDVCRQLLQRDPTNLEPAMFVFAQTGGKENEQEVLEHLGRCHQNPTTRARYVASVIEGVMKRTGRGAPQRR